MIWGLRGILVEHNITSVILDVRGVHYEVRVTSVPEASLGYEMFLYTHQVIREDEHYLVGFTSKAEKALFIKLINVNGVGPKTAIGILTATTPDRFTAAIASEDVVYLKKLPGVGPKGASQIILDLKGRLQTNVQKGGNPYNDEVALALSNLGFKKDEITKTLTKLDSHGLNANELLKLALAELRK